MQTKTAILFLLLFWYPVLKICSQTQQDSLLQALDKAIDERLVYTQVEKDKINELKKKRSRLKTPDEIYQTNRELINEYQSFICDSAEKYIHENIAMADEMGNNDYLSESKLQLAYVYSLSGLFVQAVDILRDFDYATLPANLKALYCWNHITYYENLIRYTDDNKYTAQYLKQKEAFRDSLLVLLDKSSDEYLKEKAFKYQEWGKYEEAVELLIPIFEKQQKDTHGFAMAAMSLAKVYDLADNDSLQKEYLALAAITDTRFAVKENEALLTLAVKLHEEGEIDRPYRYINVALDDANFYNSRFRNSLITRVQPIIESNYLFKIERQRRNLRIYSILISVFVVTLGAALFYIYKQIKNVSKARSNLRGMNDELVTLNQKLDEANLVKEKYVGYFMNQCAVYVNKLDEYRKNVNRKIIAGQIDDLYQSTSRTLKKEVDDLYDNFDRAFLNLYPDFVEEFNSLLKPAEQYKEEKGQLNTELRIFALIRMGITDVSQIAVFLHYSVQTIYNYKSKVKAKSAISAELFEERVKKLGSITQN